jgi:phospholipid/cholesterol/gamma-HCH transport system permease protein
MQDRIVVERDGRSAIVRLRGDLVVPRARELYNRLRSVAKRRDVRCVILDFRDAARIDSSAVAAISLVRRQLERSGKSLELTGLDEQHRAALALVPRVAQASPEPGPSPEGGLLERTGERCYAFAASARGLLGLLAEAMRQIVAVATRRARLPDDSITIQIGRMGVDAIFIVALLSFLIGTTTAFQGSIQLQRFGAGVFVADLLGLSMVRELAPLMTAVILTGRTGAAIAAELGTMRVRSEIDALHAMGINPVRFLVVPRLLAISFVVPALTLLAMFVGMAGGMLVAALTLDMPPTLFWSRMVERVDLWDYSHGLGKSFVFAWIIGLAGSHLGLRAGTDAGSVGQATTRTVVSSVFFIVIVDAIFASISTFVRYG